jgi:outer membrane protein assembly factor BamD
MNHNIKTLIGLVLILNACSTTDNEYDNRTADEIFKEGEAKLNEKSYKKAAKILEQVSVQHPYADKAMKSQILAGYSHYMEKAYPEAIETFRNFIQMHPGHKDVPYALYMLGLSFYEQMPLVERDLKIVQESYDAFNELTHRFPKSPYTKDATHKMKLLLDHLASKEMEIGIFYHHHGNALAALNRFRYVVDEFQKTPQIPEAMYRMVVCYVSLGINDQAKSTASVLGHNYPKSIWYKKAFELLNERKIPFSLSKSSPTSLEKNAK